LEDFLIAEGILHVFVQVFSAHGEIRYLFCVLKSAKNFPKAAPFCRRRMRDRLGFGESKKVSKRFVLSLSLSFLGGSIKRKKERRLFVRLFV
jgi:hypothetical protein